MITVGVDTHKDLHVAVALDGLGRRLGTLNVPTSLAGYKELVAWANGFGPLERAGVEGTGSFGCGLARFLRAKGIEVFEVIRPKRRDQYRSGKSDPIDAEAAARAVSAGTATGRPKGTDGEVEMIRALRAARRSAVKARAQAANQLKAMLITAPEGLKSELRALSTAKLVTKVSRFRPGTSPSDVETATKFALRSVARRYQRLSEEISELDERLDRLVAEAAPELLVVWRALAPIRPPRCRSPPVITLSDSKTRRTPTRTCAGLPRYRPLRARLSATASTVTATAMPTEPSM